MNLRILHLSDLYIRAIEKNIDPAAVLNADIVNSLLLKQIKAIADHEHSIDLIIITGDIAFSGKLEEYRIAEIFINELLTITELTRRYLFLIPGNHDIDRSRVKKRHVETFYQFEDQDDITGVITDQDFFTCV